MGWEWGFGGGWGGWLVMLLGMALWLVAAGVIVWAVVRALAGPRAGDRGIPPPPRADDPEEILRSRFARGEIDAEELEQRLAVLRRSRGAGA